MPSRDRLDFHPDFNRFIVVLRDQLVRPAGDFWIVVVVPCFSEVNAHSLSPMVPRLVQEFVSCSLRTLRQSLGHAADCCWKWNEKGHRLILLLAKEVDSGPYAVIEKIKAEKV